MADRGGPTEQDRSEGMASRSEPPDVRGKSTWLLGAGPRRHFQVTRRKGETNISRNRSNGYVHQQNLSAQDIAIAGKPAPTVKRVHPTESSKMEVRFREQARSHTLTECSQRK